MSLQILREIAQNVQSSNIYTKMADETADNLTPHEELIGMHPLVNNSADHIILVIKDILLQMNLKIENARGQCYYGASANGWYKIWSCNSVKVIERKMSFYTLLWVRFESCCW